jgi:hypothetical protein
MQKVYYHNWRNKEKLALIIEKKRIIEGGNVYGNKIYHGRIAKKCISPQNVISGMVY